MTDIIADEIQKLRRDISDVLLAPAPKLSDAERAARQSASIVKRSIRGAASMAWRMRQYPMLAAVYAYAGYMPVLLVGAMYAVTIALLSGKTVVRAGSRLLLALLDLISRYVSKVPAVLVRHMLQLPLDVPYAALYVATTTVRGVIRTILGTKRLSDRARHKLLAALESQKPAVLNALVSPAAPLPMPSQADLPRVAAALRPIAAHMSDRPTSSPRKSSPGRNRRSPSRNRRSPSRNRRSPGKPSPRTGRRTT